MTKNNVYSGKLLDLTPDPRNHNKGTERGRYMLERSLTELGAGRSILVDKHNTTIAGAKTLETAVESGFEDAIVVETDGTKLVVVKRTDLDLSKDERAKKLSVADNRVSEISLDYDIEVLAELNEEIDFSWLYFEDELDDLLKGVNKDSEENEEESPNSRSHKEIHCTCPNCGHEFIKT